MKIKEQTRKLAAGCSKHCFEVVDRTDEVSSKHCFEVTDGSWRGLKRFSKSVKTLAFSCK
ncbi:3-ketoacyl-(Acyl-carrier-protein) reductase [Streptococcus mitis]|uniref:3-ketoacyl-(Acyl-carrier-protein) reductase n=1 Tax=Streptococcus mitis TaxID=28037 RepID=A0A081Q4D2_STRMT|nr:3-ketoacyl-(Acyl-carrier-protein) reductase [Streptococcus mitis]